MEIAFFVIAIIGLLALTQGGSGGSVTLRGSVSVPQGTYVPITSPPPEPQAWTPTAAQSLNAPMVPSQGANVTGRLFTASAAIGTGLLTTTATGTSALASIGIVGAAVPVVGAAIAAAVAIAAAILAAHEARLKGATTENQAVDLWIPVFDSFVSQVTTAYNSGKINAQQAAQIIQQFDQTLYSKFRSFVGQPGTAWNDNPAGCDKQCTVGCCIYFFGLGAPLHAMSDVLGFPTSGFATDYAHKYLINGRTITFLPINPSKYSSYKRAGYSITLT